MKAWSSASTKRFQRITVSFAPGSGFHGAACAQALAQSSNAGPASAVVAASAVPPCTRVRRENLLMVGSSFGLSGVKPLAGRLIEEMHKPRVGLEPDAVAGPEIVPFAEHRNDVVIAELGDHLELGA